MSTRNLECWFGVGKPDSHHSMVWKVWGSRNKPDFYVAARSWAGIMKASIHASGHRRVGLTTEYVRQVLEGKTLETGVRFGAVDTELATRHYDSWEGGIELGTPPVATVEFVIRFPTADLRPFPLTQSDLAKNVLWFAPAPAGEVCEVFLLHIPPEAQLPAFSSAVQSVSAGRLSDGRQLFLVGKAVPDRRFKNQAQVLQDAVQRLRADGLTPATLSAEARVVTGFEFEGLRGFTEFAASSMDDAAIEH